MGLTGHSRVRRRDEQGYSSSQGHETHSLMSLTRQMRKLWPRARLGSSPMRSHTESRTLIAPSPTTPASLGLWKSAEGAHMCEHA